MDRKRAVRGPAPRAVVTANGRAGSPGSDEEDVEVMRVEWPPAQLFATLCRPVLTSCKASAAQIGGVRRWLCLHRGRDLPGEDLELTSPNWMYGCSSFWLVIVRAC